MTYLGPSFQLVETVSYETFVARGGFSPRSRPLLVTGLLTEWPALTSWSFEHLASLASDQVIATFQNGLIEQGATKEPIALPVGPYIRGLAETVPQEIPHGLADPLVVSQLGKDESFHLNWDYLTTFTPRQVYLGQWDIFRALPQLRHDLRLHRLWKWRSNWPSVWIGPQQTVTGLHTDYPNNWFCQIKGDKEFVLFSADNRPFISPSSKYDCGSELSQVDVMRLHEHGPEATLLARSRGVYARVRPGDALFVPRHTWHSVVSLSPSISLSVFGLTMAERLTGGVKEIVLDALHHAGWYRRGNCTCHGAPDAGISA